MSLSLSFIEFLLFGNSTYSTQEQPKGFPEAEISILFLFKTQFDIRWDGGSKNWKGTGILGIRFTHSQKNKKNFFVALHTCS